jgi:hypothetical protein
MLVLLIRNSCKQKSRRSWFKRIMNWEIFRGHGRFSPLSRPNYRQTGRLPVGSPCS